MNLLQNITTALAPVGLNLIGTTPVADYEALVASKYHIDTLLPTAKTVIVIGNGGGEFWQHFRAYADARPGYFQQHEHPLDAYTVEIIESTLTHHLDLTRARYRYIYPFQFFDGLTVSFMHLTQAAGLAGPSILGVMIHPEYGPWMALRARRHKARSRHARRNGTSALSLLRAGGGAPRAPPGSDACGEAGRGVSSGVLPGGGVPGVLPVDAQSPGSGCFGV